MHGFALQRDYFQNVCVHSSVAFAQDIYLLFTSCVANRASKCWYIFSAVLLRYRECPFDGSVTPTLLLCVINDQSQKVFCYLKRLKIKLAGSGSQLWICAAIVFRIRKKCKFHLAYLYLALTLAWFDVAKSFWLSNSVMIPLVHNVGWGLGNKRWYACFCSWIVSYFFIGCAAIFASRNSDMRCTYIDCNDYSFIAWMDRKIALLQHCRIEHHVYQTCSRFINVKLSLSAKI